MALTLSVVFLGSLCSLILIGKVFKNEKAINENLKALNITKIMVAHRKETIDSADRVINLGAAVVWKKAVWNPGFINSNYAVAACSFVSLFLAFNYIWPPIESIIPIRKNNLTALARLAVCLRLAALLSYFFEWV